MQERRKLLSVADNTPFAMGYRRNNAGSEAEQQKLRDEAVKTAADADAVLFFLAMEYLVRQVQERQRAYRYLPV